VKALDVLVLAKIIAGQPSSPGRALAASLALDRSTTQRSLRRLQEAGLLVGDGVDGARALEFLEHAVKYLVPGRVEEREVQGWPTSSFAAPFHRQFGGGGVPIVWPDRRGSARGRPLAPLTEDVPKLVRDDAALYEVLACIDMFRVGRARQRRVARDHLARRLADQGAFGHVA
jgi:hypothetical protein